MMQLDIKIVKGEPTNLEDCYEALMNSELGRVYFTSFDVRTILIEGLENREIDVAMDEDGSCIGFIWYERRGAFGMHTYLHMIAVKEAYRGRGIEKKLIANFEENTFKEDSMIFLMVADFNGEAERLYENIGYKRIAVIPGFYRKDVEEHLMMKSKQ
jgi:ribosomal protein S18 acetylase RimI-like enzyme